MRLKSQIFALSCLLAALSAMPAVANQSMPPTIAKDYVAYESAFNQGNYAKRFDFYSAQYSYTFYGARMDLQQISAYYKALPAGVRENIHGTPLSVQLHGATCIIVRRVDATVQNPPPAEKTTSVTQMRDIWANSGGTWHWQSSELVGFSAHAKQK